MLFTKVGVLKNVSLIIKSIAASCFILLKIASAVGIITKLKTRLSTSKVENFCYIMDGMKKRLFLPALFSKKEIIFIFQLG